MVILIPWFKIILKYLESYYPHIQYNIVLAYMPG